MFQQLAERPAGIDLVRPVGGDLDGGTPGGPHEEDRGDALAIGGGGAPLFPDCDLTLERTCQLDEFAGRAGVEAHLVPDDG